MESFCVDEILEQDENSIGRENELEADFYYALFPILVSFEKRIESLLRKHSDAGYLCVRNESAFIKNIAGQINFYIKEKLLAYTLVHELSIAKDAGILEGETSDERFSFFIRRITSDPEWLEYYFEKYPVLRKRINDQVVGILVHVDEILQRFNADFNQLRFIIGSDKVVLNGVQLFLGDTHKNGRTVSLLTFDDGIKIVYKPRSLENEVAFENFVSFLNELGAELNIGTPKILSTPEYGWMEYIEYEECTGLDGIDAHYTNIGSMLCLFYLLGTHDIMPDNMILRGDRSYLIDLECLMNKPLRSGYSLKSASSFQGRPQHESPVDGGFDNVQ